MNVCQRLNVGNTEHKRVRHALTYHEGMPILSTEPIISFGDVDLVARIPNDLLAIGSF